MLTVVILALFCSPYFMGMISEKKIQTLAKRASANPDFSVKVSDYQRGWFASTVTLDLQTQSAILNRHLNMPSNVALLQVKQCKITHGPLILANINGKRKLTYGQACIVCKDQSASTQQSQLASENMNISLHIHFNGSVSGELSFDELIYSNDKFKTTFKQGKMTAKINNQFNQVSHHLSINSIEIGDQKNGVQINAIKSQGNVSQSDYNLWVGEHISSIAAVVIFQQGTSLFKLEDQHYQHNTSLEGDVINTAYLLDIEKVKSLGKDVGPIKLDIAFDNLDAQALSQLLVIAKKSMQQLLHHDVNINAQEYSEKVQSLLPILLNRGFRLAFDPLYIQLPEGGINLQVNVTFPEQQEKSVSIEQLMLGSDAALVITVPKKFARSELMKAYILSQARQANGVKQSPSQIKKRVDDVLSQLLGDGVISERDDDYLFSIGYKQQKIYLNDIQVPTIDALINKWSPVDVFLAPVKPAEANSLGSIPDSSSSE